MKKERITIKDIAGFCPEEAIWKMLADVSDILLKDEAEHTLAPESIVIAGNSFFIESQQTINSEFMAPEQESTQAPMRSQMVWILGAIAYYMATGHVVFGGHGGKYQKEHPAVPLPVLPKALQTLTPVLHRCLCAAPKDRINMEELNAMAKQGQTYCSNRQRERNTTTSLERHQPKKYQGEKWPEKMIEL